MKVHSGELRLCGHATMNVVQREVAEIKRQSEPAGMIIQTGNCNEYT